MRKCVRFILILLFSFPFHGMFSQDIIYLNNGTKFEATVKEITPSEIKYKNVSNPDGPTYVIAASDVLFVEFKNGTVEVINKNPKPYSPQASTPTAGEEKKVKKPTETDLHYLNKNAIMINGMALANADITLFYERDLLQSHLGITVMGGYNFNRVATWPNLYLHQLNNPKKNYDVGLGINFYPSNRRKAQYFMGILAKYMSYSFDREVITEEEINGFMFQKITTEKAQGYQLAGMFVNGVQYRITPTINYKIFVGIGPFTADDDLKKEMSNNGTVSIPKMYLGLCIGYRF